MTLLYRDYESSSELDLSVVGLHNYINHPSTRPTMMAWAIDDGQVNLWERHLNGQFPPELQEATDDPEVIHVAWNCQFERAVDDKFFDLRIPLTRWDDPMIRARFLSMPGYLEEVSAILKLGQDAKMSWGTKKDPGEAQRLINKFCSPAIKGGEETLFGIRPAWFHDYDSDPEDWFKFGEYCKQDVSAMRAAYKKICPFPLPERERQAWYIDAEINNRGIFCDLELARGSAAVAEQVKKELHDQIRAITKVDNPNANPQILRWIKTQGYSFSGLSKGFVMRARKGECDLTDDARKVLELREQSAKTSDSKLETILASVCSDGRLRHQYAFMGASRTGRWSGKGDYGGAQLQNLPRASKAVAKRLDTAIDLLRKADYLGLSLEFPSPMDAVSTAIRSVLRAAPGKKLLICDLNAIENRVLGWMTGCDAIADVFRQGKCPYLSFAVHLYNLPYEELAARYEAGDEEAKEMRQNSKAPILGGGYQLSGGEEIEDEETGDKIFTGLMNYSRMMGIEMPRDLCHQAITTFRENHPEVVQFWYDSQDAALEAVRTGKVTEIGPLTFKPYKSGLLQMILPSGRPLNYIRPKIEMDEKYRRESVTYEGKDQKTHKWVRLKAYGGKWTEQSDQGIARDLLVAGMVEATRIGLPIVSHTHDELVCEVDKESKFALDDLRACMIKVPDWTPGLILDAEGFTSEYYKK